MITENDIMIENTDVAIISGDFDIQDVNSQNIRHILIAQPGDYPVCPSIGATIQKFQNDNIVDLRQVLSTIAQELGKDGYAYPDFYNQTQETENVQMTISAKRITIPKREVI